MFAIFAARWWQN